MTRRLVVALLVFTALVLLITMVPLGLSISARDRTDFASATRSLAQSVATLAEDSFDDPKRPLPASRLVAAAGKDVWVQVLDRSGQPVVSTGPTQEVPSRLLTAAHNGSATTTDAHDDVMAAAPVIADGTNRGVVVVSRPDEAVEDRVARLWAVLAIVAAGALVLSVVIAAAAAAWVGRPLRRLGATSQRWSEGSLHERADPTSGPPEVREVATALNAMAARLDTLVHASRAVVADVSHQLRTPLSAMRLRLELAREELDGTAGAAVDEDIALSLAEIERLSRLVDGLLTVARAESTDTASVPVDVAAVIRERLQAWQPVASEQHVTIEADLPATGVIASATPGHLEQILDNVLDNALEAVAEGGAITMVVRREDERIRVDIRDTGVGMSDQLRAQAFRRFASGRDGTGSGLGLAVVHRLVTADGGSVEIDSAPGRGTVVSVWLPAARRDPSHQADASVDHLDR